MTSLLIISPLLPATGNTSTVARLRDHFTNNEIKVQICCPGKFLQNEDKCSVSQLNSFIEKNNIFGVILLHAYKSGRCVVCYCNVKCSLKVKYGVVFGGTDINENTKVLEHISIMESCIASSTFCVSFTDDMKSKALNYFPQSNVLVQPQALDYSSFHLCCNLAATTPTAEPMVFVLPCTIRPVKDPLFILEEFMNLVEICGKDVRLLILGSSGSDDKYSELFLDKIKSVLGVQNQLDFNSNFHDLSSPIPPIRDDTVGSWLDDQQGSKIQFIPSIPHEEFLEFLRGGNCFCVLNTSLSEGMAAAILEAMSSSTLVLCRDIPANQAIVEHGGNGLLFSTPEEFSLCAVEVLNDSEFRGKLVENARDYVLSLHNPLNEAEFYLNCVRNYLCS